MMKNNTLTISDLITKLGMVENEIGIYNENSSRSPFKTAIFLSLPSVFSALIDGDYTDSYAFEKSLENKIDNEKVMHLSAIYSLWSQLIELKGLLKFFLNIEFLPSMVFNKTNLNSISFDFEHYFQGKVLLYVDRAGNNEFFNSHSLKEELERNSEYAYRSFVRLYRLRNYLKKGDYLHTYGLWNLSSHIKGHVNSVYLSKAVLEYDRLIEILYAPKVDEKLCFKDFDKEVKLMNTAYHFVKFMESFVTVSF